MIDFMDNGVLRTLTFASSRDFDVFLISQGAGCLEQVGSGACTRDFEKVVDGAAYSIVFAGSSPKSNVTVLRARPPPP